MLFRQYFDPKLAQYAYLVGCQRTGEAIVIARVAPDQFRAWYDVPSETTVYGPYAGRLDNDGERLSLEKLVNIMSRRGMFVAGIGISDLAKLFEMRVVMEKMAAELAAKRGRPEHWRRMTAVLADLPSPDHPDYNERLITIDQSCHEIIYQAADNPFLADALTTTYALSLRLWYYSLYQIGDMRGAITEHQQILDALKNGDSQESARLMGQHIQAFQEEIQTVMMGA